QRSFEISSGHKLDSFFQQRLERVEIPSLKVKDIEVTFQNNKPVLSFTLLQLTESPFSLLVPIRIQGVNTTTTRNQFINEKETRISMVLDSRPLKLTIDPKYSFLRELHQPEMTAVWARFMGAEDRLVILASEKERAIYSSFLKALEKNEQTVKLSSNVTNQELGENSLLFLGMDQNAARSLFGAPNHKKEGFTLDVRTNPLNPEHVAVLVSSSGKAETDAIAGRIGHYGKYSFLHFLHGRNLEKKISSTQFGIHIVLEELPDGGKTSSIASFNQVIDELSNSRVIYIGETHTSLSDHLLQLRIIQALYAKDPDLAIGMEMFPATVQSALDRYVLSGKNLDERIFLKESEYFNVWRYDYRFFRDIINFARTNKIPVRGLNLDKDIVSTVFSSGNTDSLEETTLKSLPAERDLDLPGYRERLSMMHAIHIEGSHGSGKISGFLQAQGLWDETMADNIVSYLKDNPKRRMVVLAGAQHSRKDSGIPPRVKRRLDIEQSSVLNIYSSFSPSNLAQVADYYFLAGASDLPETPKIGIVLTTVEDDNQPYLKISQISPHGKAGEAGLLEGDILKTIKGFPVTDMADLRIAMMDAREGETILVKVLRNDGNSLVEKEFQVELSSSRPPMMHP
ncbi:MAG: ChaN family lipoprotein, partial [Deltaproteobacteria bacterium]|nr:ChaN family lipoprotein [Deltaproteobacteria bacterium]